MPAIAGEPFRGLTKIHLDDATGTRAYTVSIDDVAPLTATGDQATWEGTPGSSVTLRLEWASTGTPTFSVADTITVAVRLPGDNTNIGATWTPSPGTGTSGTLTTTLHFDDNPLNGVLGAIRAGMLEVFLQIQRTAAVGWGPVDSRGGGTPPAGSTFTWSRGYLRAPVTMTDFSVSDASLGGAEPGVFYATKPCYTRVTFDATWYRAAASTLRHKQGATTTRQGSSASGTSAIKEWSWTAATSSVGGTGRINKDYVAALTATQVEVTMPGGLSFGGDDEYYYATSGHVAGWTRASSGLLTDADRISVDPRIQFTQLLQRNDDAYGTPPMSKDVASGRLLNTDFGYISSRARDMGGTGLNGIQWQELLWDDAELIGFEGGPVDSRFQTGSTQGGEDGWGNGFVLWDEVKPGGNWNQKQTLSTTDLSGGGLEVTNTRTLVLLAADPRVSVVVGAGPTTKSRHFTPGQTFQAGISAINVDTGKRLSIDASGAYVALFRNQDGGANAGYGEFLDSDLVWKRVDAAATIYFWPCTETIAGNTQVWIKTFTASQTSGWGTYDIFLIGKAIIGGVPYGSHEQGEVVGPYADHGAGA